PGLRTCPSAPTQRRLTALSENPQNCTLTPVFVAQPATGSDLPSRQARRHCAASQAASSISPDSPPSSSSGVPLNPKMARPNNVLVSAHNQATTTTRAQPPISGLSRPAQRPPATAGTRPSR